MTYYLKKVIVGSGKSFTRFLRCTWTVHLQTCPVQLWVQIVFNPLNTLELYNAARCPSYVILPGVRPVIVASA